MTSLTLDNFMEEIHSEQLRSILGNRFTIDSTQALPKDEDYTPYLRKNVGVSLEMEVDRRYGVNGLANYHTELDEYEGSLIYEFTHDPTINGPEIILTGRPMDGDEFAKIFPIKKFRKCFQISHHDSMHSHTMIINQSQTFPTLILRNAWQIFRANYPAWIWLFGNYPDRLIRGDYGRWKYYMMNESQAGVARGYGNHAHSKFCGGLHFEKTYIVNGQVSGLDAEIRCTDGSLWLDQIVSCRALSKAIFLRASDVSKAGLIEMKPEEETKIVSLGSAIYSLKEDNEILIGKDLAMRAGWFVNEMRPYMTPFEFEQVKSILEKPVRHRRLRRTDTE